MGFGVWGLGFRVLFLDNLRREAGTRGQAGRQGEGARVELGGCGL